MKKTILILVLAVIFTVACSQEVPPTEPDKNGEIIPESVENDYLGNATIVGMGVSIRESQDVSSEKLGSIDFPSQIYLLEKSDSMEKIGEDEAYWYKIRSGDLSGWCYGAFIAQDDQLHQAISDHLDDLLPVDKTATIAKSVSILKNIVSMTESVDLIDSGLIRIKELQEILMAELEKEMLPLTETLYGYKIEDLRRPENLPDGPTKALMEKYQNMGYSIYSAEGMYYLEPNPQFLLGNFKASISDDLYDYLTYRSAEVENHTFHDAAVVISWDELAERMVSWEKFMDMYPSSPYFEDAKSMYDVYRFTFLIGADNTPAYRYPTEILDPDLLETYKSYSSKYPDSSMTPLIQDLLILLKNESYKKTERVEEFLNPYNPW